MIPTRRLLAVAMAGVPLAQAGAQWSAVHEQFPLPASHNWAFRTRYPAADRLFNAFDYGHSILYQRLWSHPSAPTTSLEVTEYDFLTKKLLVSGPRLALAEVAIAPDYTRLVPEAQAMFHWAHLLHRQIYDVLADERLTSPQQDAEVAALVRYYRSRPDLAFSSQPKNMTLMDQQPYSLAFREGFPKFNGLIWGYHWLQVGLYEALLAGQTPDGRHALVSETLARFRRMLSSPPETLPYVMPMTAAVAPRFAERFPEAAIIFDNLHGMHDVISDILADTAVPRTRKRTEILKAAAHYRDDTTEVMTVAGWKRMALGMGLENQGGPPVGGSGAPPVPTLSRGTVMRHDRDGRMIH